MNRKNMPLVLMLTAGAVTCVITFVMRYSVLDKLLSLLAVLVVFYLLGNLLRFTLDFFDRQNEKKKKEEGEMIEKEEGNGEEQEENQAERTEGKQVR